MDWWQIALICASVLSAIIGGRAAWKKKWQSVLNKAAHGTREMSEAFYASSLIGIKASEILEKLANDPASVGHSDVQEAWDAVREAGAEWSEAFQAVKEIFYALH